MKKKIKDLTLIKDTVEITNSNPNKNSGYVEADYKRGIIIFKPTDDVNKNIDIKTINKLI